MGSKKEMKMLGERCLDIDDPYWIVEMSWPIDRNPHETSDLVETTGGKRWSLGSGVAMPDFIRDATFSFVTKTAALKCFNRVRKLLGRIVDGKASLMYVDPRATLNKRDKNENDNRAG